MARRFVAGFFVLLILEVAVSVGFAQDLLKRENLGPAVNTAAEELCPVISPDGKTLYFVRQGTDKNIGGPGDQDVWMSTLNPDGSWAEAVHLPGPINDSGYNTVASVLPDGNTLLLLNVYRPDGSHTQGFSYTHRTRTGWSVPQKIEVTNYYNDAPTTSAVMSNDQKAIIMSLARENSYGVRDLYVSLLSAEGVWQEPINLGPQINSPGTEGTPFLASDGVTLYFSSDGHGGYGNRDIFVSHRLDSTWEHWTPAENLGPSINTSGSDSYYTIPASGDYAYLVTDHDGFGQEDICRIALPKAMKPKPVILVSGHVLNTKTSQPIGAMITYSSLSSSKELGTANSDSTAGAYKIVLPAGDEYAFRAEAPGYYPITENIDASKLTEYQEVSRDLRLVPIERNTTIRLNNIFFEYAKADLKSESFPELDRVVKFMHDNPNVVIQISGHTDSIGNEQTNLALSKARAEAVEQYVLKAGVSASRISAKGYGKTKPVAPNSTDEGRQQNRRVEFTILKD